MGREKITSDDRHDSIKDTILLVVPGYKVVKLKDAS